MTGIILEQEPVKTLEHITSLRTAMRARVKPKALADLIGYIGQRLDMLDYPRFWASGLPDWLGSGRGVL